jgi:CRP-like cAMP-binding protein
MNISPEDLRRVDLFKDAPLEDLALLIENSLVRSIEQGGFFFFQGDPAAHAYILVAGRVKLLQSNPNGQLVNLRTVKEWEVFAALGAVRPDAAYPVAAQALEESSALAIGAEFLRGMMQTRPYLNIGLMQLMTSYINELQARYREMATERVERRLALTLLRLASQIGKRIREDDPAVELPLTRQDLAEASGSTMFTVSRILAEWERQGLLEASRGRVLISNPHGLVKIVDDDESD